MEKVIAELQNIFFQGTKYYAKAKEREGTVSYEPIEGVPSTDQLQSHLEGSLVLGSYTLLPDSTVRWICLDVDASNRQQARNITEAISEVLEDTPHGIEFSGNKGYHIWLFLTEPVSATNAKAYGEALREAVGAPTSGDPHVEVFPKQAKLTASLPMGNLVKLPLGAHPKSHNRSIFVDRLNGWETGEEVDPLSILLQRVDFQALEKNLVGSSPLQKIATLIGGYWINGERHNLALALSGFLASLGWSKDDVSTLVSSLTEANGGDEENLLGCVTSTFKRLAGGHAIQGFSTLNEQLPVNVMRALSELAGQNIADPSIQVIDRIRLEKGPVFTKIRSAVVSMLGNLRETGKFVRTENNGYWLDLAKHRLIDLKSDEWISVIHHRFGINPKEAFGIQALAALEITAMRDLPLTDVHKRYHWDGERLWINFGGAEVYCLNGVKSERKLTYNGEEDFIFATKNGGLSEDLNTVNLLEVSPLDPWEHLVNDLNFQASDANQATSDQQRQLLKAWILQLFFGNILATRPIALLTGPKGSGKTTAARRILRFFEGFTEDVLGIVEDKPDSLRASLEDRLVLALDNMEKTRVRWIDNFLNRLATGAQLELRMLYKSNQKYIIRPNVFVIVTGIELPTQEESLYSRLLPLELCPLEYPKPEFIIQSSARDNILALWAGMFDHLDGAIAQLKAVRQVNVPNASRLADYVVFCHRIKDCAALDAKLLTEGLERLTVSQNVLMANSSAALVALEAWLNDCATVRVTANPNQDPEQWRNAGELYRVLKEVAHKNDIGEFRWTTPAAFGRHWALLVQGGLGGFPMEQQEVHSKHNKRKEKVYRFPRLHIGENGQAPEPMAPEDEEEPESEPLNS